MGHYRQQLRGRPLTAIRPKEPHGRLSIRLSEVALEALGDRPAARARVLLEAWAKTMKKGRKS